MASIKRDQTGSVRGPGQEFRGLPPAGRRVLRGRGQAGRPGIGKNLTDEPGPSLVVHPRRSHAGAALPRPGPAPERSVSNSAPRTAHAFLLEPDGKGWRVLHQDVPPENPCPLSRLCKTKKYEKTHAGTIAEAGLFLPHRDLEDHCPEPWPKAWPWTTPTLWTSPPQVARTAGAARGQGRTGVVRVAMPVYGGRLPKLGGRLARDPGHPGRALRVPGGLRQPAPMKTPCWSSRTSSPTGAGSPVACAAFVAEHSFSSDDVPIAVARPDSQDLKQAEAFGAAVPDEAGRRSGRAGIPGRPRCRATGPYKERKPPMTETFIVVGDNCTQCGQCQEICPVGGAIDLEQDIQADMGQVHPAVAPASRSARSRPAG